MNFIDFFYLGSNKYVNSVLYAHSQVGMSIHHITSVVTYLTTFSGQERNAFLSNQAEGN